jgi:hypothetical protein
MSPRQPANRAKAEAAEYDRLLGLVRSGKIEGDPTLIIFSSDGLLQFSRADLIPWFYCSTARVGELLEDLL